jgi:hypothetical protein
MLVVSIVGVVTVMGNRLFVQITRFFRLNQARIEIQRDARTVFNLISRNVRQAYASSVVIDNCSSTTTPSCTSTQPPYSRLTFTKVTGESITYYQDGKYLYQVSTGTKKLTENLRYIAFSHPESAYGDIVSISLTLEKATYQAGTKALQLSVEKVRIMND